jgi:hypothetical protein
MRLSDYLEKNEPGDPPAGTIGAESDWLEVGTLEVTTGSLWAGDPYLCTPDDGCVVKVPPGTYIVEAKGMDFDGRRRVSRMRAYLEDSTDPALCLGRWTLGLRCALSATPARSIKLISRTTKATGNRPSLTAMSGISGDSFSF